MNSTISSVTLMGILNITPDSFSDGGKYNSTQAAVERVKTMIKQGASMIDIGAESSRPGAKALSSTEEIKRLDPILQAIKKENINTTVSIDTYKTEVAEYCLKYYQVDIINDITGLRDPHMAPLIAKYNAGIIIMHMQGTPQTMQTKPIYTDIIDEISVFLDKQRSIATQAGIQNIILDPGIGFGKSMEDNFTIIKELAQFKILECPILIGASRKSCIGHLTGASIENRLPGTLAMHLRAKEHKVDILRVHDVAEHVQALKVWNTT